MRLASAGRVGDRIGMDRVGNDRIRWKRTNSIHKMNASIAMHQMSSEPVACVELLLIALHLQQTVCTAQQLRCFAFKHSLGFIREI